MFRVMRVTRGEQSIGKSNREPNREFIEESRLSQRNSALQAESSSSEEIKFIF